MITICLHVLYMDFNHVHVLFDVKRWVFFCKFINCVLCLNCQVTNKATGMNMDLLTSRIGLCIHLTVLMVTGGFT